MFDELKKYKKNGHFFLTTNKKVLNVRNSLIIK